MYGIKVKRKGDKTGVDCAHSAVGCVTEQHYENHSPDPCITKCASTVYIHYSDTWTGMNCARR